MIFGGIQEITCYTHKIPDGGFVLIGPQSIGETVTAMVTGQRDNAQNNRTIIKGTVEDSVVPLLVLLEFTIDSTDPNNVITGFDVVRQGLTLRNTTSGTDGVYLEHLDFTVQQQTLIN